MVNHTHKIVNFFVILFKHLFLSFYSTELYQNILKKYKGYGLKYFMNLIFLGEIIFFIIFITICFQIEKYFTEGLVSNIFTKNIDYIMSQIPKLQVSNGSVSFVERSEEVTYLYNTNNKAIVAIDLTQNSKNHNTSIIFNKEYIHINPFVTNNITKFFTFKIFDIVGSEEKLLDQVTIKNILAKIFFKFQESFSKNLIITIPLIFGLLTLNLIAYQLQTVFFIYLITNFLMFKITFKSSLRISFFAGGVFALLYPSMFFLDQVYIDLMFGIKIIPYCVMFYSFWKLKRIFLK